MNDNWKIMLGLLASAMIAGTYGISSGDNGLVIVSGFLIFVALVSIFIF